MLQRSRRKRLCPDGMSLYFPAPKCDCFPVKNRAGSIGDDTIFFDVLVLLSESAVEWEPSQGAERPISPLQWFG